MRGFIQAILGALAALRNWCWRIVDGVLRLIQVAPIDQATPPGHHEGEAFGPVPPTQVSKYERIRRLAAELVRNSGVPPAELLRGIGPTAASWLAAMSDEMLVKVARAKDHDLAEHMAGRRSMQGVLAFDAGTIADYIRAISRTAPSGGSDDDLDAALVPRM